MGTARAADLPRSGRHGHRIQVPARGRGHPDPDRLRTLSGAPPRRAGAPDWIVVESTYGDRMHPKSDPFEALASILTKTCARGGALLIPSFAVGRAQTLLYCFHEIFRRQLAAEVPVYVNSPMAWVSPICFDAPPPIIASTRLSRVQSATSRITCAAWRSRGISSEGGRLASSFRPAGWLPEDACSITCARWRRIRATRWSFPASRHPARAATRSCEARGR